MTTAPAGWHPDPSNPHSGLRYWDGSAWTEHTAPHPPAAPTAPAAPAAPYGTYPAYTTGGAAVAQRTVLQRNTFSFVTIGCLLLYVLLAFTVHIVFLGILPVIMCVRAFRAKEPLAPAAAVAAVIAVGFALLALR